MALLPPFFLDCVVSIGVPGANNTTTWIGTGFFYGYPAEKNQQGQQLYATFLVTNKHVIGDNKELWIRLNPKDGQAGKDLKLDAVDQNGKHLWFTHSDAEIDLAITPINSGFIQGQKLNFSFFEQDRHVAFLEDLKTGALSEGDPVYVLGFPMGQTGSKRFYAICRSGVVARCRDWLEQHRKEILIDASVFPGNSGGPVISSIYLSSITGTKPRNKADLIGVVQSYLPYQDVAISQQTKRPRIIFEENSGLASVIPADFIKVIIEEFMLKQNSQPKLPLEVKDTKSAL